MVHPDRNQGVPGSHEAQQRVNAADDVLQKRRREYDAQLGSTAGSADGQWAEDVEDEEDGEDGVTVQFVACHKCRGNHIMKVVR
jgi:DnaJ-class molecular chaperone